MQILDLNRERVLCVPGSTRALNTLHDLHCFAPSYIQWADPVYQAVSQLMGVSSR